VENVYTHNWMAYLRFHNFRFRQCHLVAQVAFWGEVAFLAEVRQVLVGVWQFLCASSVSADSLLYYFGMDGSWPCDFYKPLPGVFLSLPSTFYAPETQLLASSLLRLWRRVFQSFLCFLYCGVGKPSVGHFSHIQDKAHVGLFQL